MNISQVIRLGIKRNNTLVCMHSYGNYYYMYLINNTVATYRYFSLRSWDKDHSLQNELKIPIERAKKLR